MHINLKDKKLFGNEAGEDEDIEVLNAYYVDNSDLDVFFDPDEKLSVVSARKGMGKSALLSRLEYRLNNDEIYENPIVIRVKGTELLGLGQFDIEDHAYLENYWKRIICKKIIVEIGDRIGVALSSDAMSMVEVAEIDGLKSKNFIGGLISRVRGKVSDLDVEFKASIPDNLGSLLSNYQARNENSNVWILIDDIDAKYQNTSQGQARVGSFFSAIRSLAFDMRNLNIRSTVRSDVWSCLRHLEDLDKLEQYIINMFWTKRHMRDMLTKKVFVYILKKHPDSDEAKYKVSRDYNKILDIVFSSPIEWRGKPNARLFDAISAFSNRRPRWMGQLCRMAGSNVPVARENRKITLENINHILSDFGAKRRDDLIKEHSHQFDELLNLIDSLRATKKEFSYSELNVVLSENFIRSRAIEDIPLVDGKKYLELEDLGDFLYKLGLISRIHDDGITFTHFTDDPDLYKSIENRNDNVTWSIHPSYRTFLNIR